MAVGEGGLVPLDVSAEFIGLVAEIGVLLLLLTLGLEYTGDELRHGLRTGLVPGVTDAVVNFTPGLLAGVLLGWDPTVAVLLGGVCWVSSSGIVATGAYVPPTSQTLGDYFDQWHTGAATRLRPKTLESYRQVFDRYVRPALGDVRLQSVTALQLDGLYAALLRNGGAGGRPLSPTTVIHVHAVVSKILSDALRKGLVVRNVAQVASPPRQLRPTDRNLSIWSAEQLTEFLRSVQGQRLYALWRLYAVSGCRRGEALAATWDDLDLERGRWGIRRSLVTLKGSPVFGSPKAGRGRTVALDGTTVTALRAHRLRQAEERLAWGPAYQDAGLVFCRENGTVLHPNEITRLFVRLPLEAGLPRIRLHDVRHSAVTALLRAGVPVKVVSERVGHASTSFTQDVYASVLPDMQQDAAERLAAALDG